MYKNKKFLKFPKPNEKKEKLIKPVGTDKQGYRDELSDYIAIYETKSKPPPKLTNHKDIFE